MTATSATGVGLGSSHKYTTRELAILANYLNIMAAGRIDLQEDEMINPPSPTATITFITPLPGSQANYTVLITSLNAGSIYVASMTDNDAGNFSEFQVIGEAEGSCMYMVLQAGVRPNL